jgi:hypothetical protein
MMRYIIIIIMVLPLTVLAKNKQFYYEPQVIELTGVVKTLKFPGPPNYTSIKEGDADETGPYLVLHDPIDVLASKSNDNTSEKNVKLLQLVVKNKNDWVKVYDGNKVHIIGTLFQALTGHHHARVLLTVENISLLSFQSSRGNDLHLTREDQQFLQHENLQE